MKKKEVKYIVDVPVSFIEFCYKNAKSKQQKMKIKKLLDQAKREKWKRKKT